jgi:hypothetical protein
MQLQPHLQLTKASLTVEKSIAIPLTTKKRLIITVVVIEEKSAPTPLAAKKVSASEEKSIATPLTAEKK